MKRPANLEGPQRTLLNAVARAVAARNRAVSQSEIRLELEADGQRFGELTDLLDALNPLYIDDALGSGTRVYEPTLEGWLQTPLAGVASLTINAVLVTLRTGLSTTNATGQYTWSQLKKTTSLVDQNFPVSYRIIARADLSNGGSGTAWQINSTEWTFGPPNDVDRVIECKNADELLEYRRKEPQKLRDLRHTWANELDPSKRAAIKFIYEAFDKSGAWPSASSIETKLRRAGRKSLTELTNGSRLLRAGDPFVDGSKAALTLEGIYHAAGSEEDQRLVTRLLSTLGRLSRLDNSKTVKVSDLPEDAELDEMEFPRLAAILGPDLVENSANSELVFKLGSWLIPYADADGYEEILLTADAIRAVSPGLPRPAIDPETPSREAGYAPVVTPEQSGSGTASDALQLGPTPRVLKYLDGGTEADVYLVEDRFGRKVAAKVFSESKRVPEHIYGHAIGLARVPHPAVATLYAIDEVVDTSGRRVPAILMEVLSGEELEQRLRRPISVDELLQWGKTLIEIFEAMHSVEHFHPDPHAGNFFVTDRGLRMYDVLYSLTADQRSTRTKESLRSSNARSLREILQQMFDCLPRNDLVIAASRRFSTDTRNVDLRLSTIRQAFGDAFTILRPSS